MATATARKSPARKARAPRAAAEPKVDAYQVITDQIIELLEAGVAPWRKPWDANAGIPLSMSTKKPYRGINPFLLQTAAQAKGYSSPWWGTYKQIAERGGQVRTGEKATTIVFWKMIPITDEATGQKKTIPFLRMHSVFNADQAEGELGLPDHRTVRNTADPIVECDKAVAQYLADGPSLIVGGDRACYSPSLDTVMMPERSAFGVNEEYYSALFHELTHSTGHADRLARPDLLQHHAFGDESYSKEELVAELGSSFLAGLTGIATVTLPNSASYLQSWIRALKGDKRLVVSAAGQAQKAAELILGVTHETKTEVPA